MSVIVVFLRPLGLRLVGAHGTFAPPTGGCSQASAHVARHDGAAGRRKTARRQEVVGSVDERSAVGVYPQRVAPQAGATRARSESESWRDPETRSTRKGRRRVARHVPDGDVDRRGSPGGGDTLRRTANRATAPARERVSSSVGVPARRIFRLQTSIDSCSFPVRPAERHIVRVASDG